jgi:putative acetyltransferase
MRRIVERSARAETDRPVNIRPYAASDLTAVVELITDAVHVGAADQYTTAQRSAWAPIPPDLEYWRTRLDGVHMLVAELDSQLIGVISYEDDGHIDLLYTSPAFVRKGIASALYDRAEAALRTKGARELFTEASLIARPFFARQGFELVEEEVVTRRGVELARLRMRKTLRDLSSHEPIA